MTAPTRPSDPGARPPARRLAAALALTLAGCGWAADLNPFAEKEPELPCPYVRVLAAGDRYVRFREGPGRDLTDVALEAEFVNVAYDCTYHGGGGLGELVLGESADRPGEAGMTLDLMLQVAARHGPAASGRPEEDVPYFVAVLGPDRAILDKRVFNALLSFSPEAGGTAVSDPEEIRIDFPSSGGAAGWQYEVVLSFQLTPEQLDYLRAQLR